MLGIETCQYIIVIAKSWNKYKLVLNNRQE